MSSTLKKWLGFGQPTQVDTLKEILEALKENDKDKAIKITEEAIVNLGGELDQELVETNTQVNYTVSDKDYRK